MSDPTTPPNPPSPQPAGTPAAAAPVQSHQLSSLPHRRPRGRGLVILLAMTLLLMGVGSVVVWLTLERLKAATRPPEASPLQGDKPLSGRKFEDLFRTAQASAPIGAASSAARATPSPSAPGGATPKPPGPVPVAVPAIAQGLPMAAAEPIPVRRTQAQFPSDRIGEGRAARGGNDAFTMDAIPSRGSASRPYKEPGPYDGGFTVSGGSSPGEVAAAGRPAAERTGAVQGAAGAGFGGGMGNGNSESPSGLGAMLTPTSTPAAKARMLGNLDMVVPEGTTIPCVLRTRIVAGLPGMVVCRTSSPAYSANGRVVLLERGSVVTGEQTATMKQGQTRLFVLWRRVVTPEGVTIALNSPAADSLGGAGVDGDVDNHWGKRIGAALLLSVVSDAIAYQTARDSNGSAASGTSYQAITQSGKSIAEKVLESTINIPPTLTRNQGDVISIMVARDLDFSTVHELRR